MTSIVGEFPPGRAIDLGCGEGGDVLWLAEQGWQAHGLDISTVAIDRARSEAAARGLERATFTAADLSTWHPEPDSVELVTAAFFQSHAALDRIEILRRAATAIRPSGHLVVISHAQPPPWSPLISMRARSWSPPGTMRPNSLSRRTHGWSRPLMSAAAPPSVMTGSHPS